MKRIRKSLHRNTLFQHIAVVEYISGLQPRVCGPVPALGAFGTGHTERINNQFHFRFPDDHTLKDALF